MKIGEFVENGNWVWPQEWRVKFPMIAQLQSIDLEPLKDDQLMWRCNDGQLRNFSVRQAYNDLSNVDDKIIDVTIPRTSKGAFDQIKSLAE
ncbi:RNA-directed DNA polymerase, eukaryota, Reverse transcriptase zinc-binding domain protein [Artemisia annua]|uniref:RNA-directed DNA polymerase, eukaryota, Reverse transcriptase zinc-binding domain protein n=1 Tax=Artemisia annua TaxID=35608 RepID=A0A2U1P3G8_ARTAN|nr:RNA-directed DNA polymerase, eukaryota, Reverse transcriptase zinc-binding domain protein [Artemisia annua]